MRIVLLLLILILLSCKKPDPVQTVNPIGPLYARLYHHKSSYLHQLKGPVKSCQTNVVTQQQDSSDIFAVYKSNRSESWEADYGVTYGFNREGYHYITTFDNGGRGVSTYENRCLRKTIYVGPSSFETPFHLCKKLLDPLSYEYCNDTVYSIVNSWPVLATSVEKGDSSVTVNTHIRRLNLSLVSLKSELLNGLFKGIYIPSYSYDIRKGYLFINDSNGQYKLDLCRSFETWGWVKDPLGGDTTFFDQVYNEEGDIIQKVIQEDVGWAPGFSVSKYFTYEYTYDQHGNWIEMVSFVNHKESKRVRREISYWK